ncbi:MAG: 50S ribosomal protein L11 methyltransferase [Gemmatimonadota bacterium]|nr:50S ribosomal protein L11 methyltransferase [Gemmatimonadota bacterium]
MRWLALRAIAPNAPARDRAVAALIGAGAAGVEEVGDALVSYLPADADVSALTLAIEGMRDGTSLEVTELGEVDWTGRWVTAVGIQRLGVLTVAPPWLADEARAAQHGRNAAPVIVIDPAMAFGTGEHATTRGMLRLMQRVLRPGDRVADLGAGSAILSIAACRLGAAWAAAIELDPDAIGNAEENVARNGVGGSVVVLNGDAEILISLVAPVRVVLANIISSTIRRLLPVIRPALEATGQAILSGILVAERAEMLDVVDREGWDVQAEDREEEWWSILIAPK